MANKITAIIDVVTTDARKSLKNLKQDITNADGAIGKFKVGVKGGFEAIKNNIGTFSLASAGALLAFGDDVLNAGVAMESMDAKAETVFGDGIGRMREWAKESAGALGMTERKAIDAGASIQDLLVPMGFAREEAQGMTLKLLDVAGALSAWSGGKKSVEEVTQTMTKAMLGEREELKSLGIAISEADVQTRLAEKGQKGLTGAALAQAKAIATQELIFEKSTDAQKAWADGSMDATKRANEGKASYAKLGETLNQTLYPVLIKLVPALTEVAQTAATAVGPLVQLSDAIDKIDGKGIMAGAFGVDEELFKIEDMRDEIEGLGLDYKRMWMEVKAGDLTLAQVTARMDEARAAQLDLTKTLDGGEKSWERTADEMKAAGKAADIGAGHLRDLERSADKAEDATRRLDAAVAALNGELDQEEAVINYDEAMQDFAETMLDGEASARDQAQAIIDAKRAALDYVTSLGTIPADKKTEIVTAISEGDFQLVKKLLDELTKQRVVDIRASFSGNSGAQKKSPTKGGDLPYFADGGVMPGPKGEHALAWVAGGEWVINPDKARADNRSRPWEIGDKGPLRAARMLHRDKPGSDDMADNFAKYRDKIGLGGDTSTDVGSSTPRSSSGYGSVTVNVYAAPGDNAQSLWNTLQREARRRGLTIFG